MMSLEALVAAEGPLGVRDALGWVLRAGLALWDLHADGIPHGRVSPAAIVVASGDCEVEGRMVRPSDLDDAPPYHSVRRAGGQGPSLEDDVWALGITLYFLLTGKLPYPKGVSAAVDEGRLRPPRPLAVHRAELDVMQPVLDRLIRADNVTIATSVEDLVFGLRDFSPTIADLPPLALERPSAPPRKRPRESDTRDWGRSEAPSTRPPADQPRAQRSQLETNMLYGATAVLVGVIAFVALTRGDDASESEARPSATGASTTHSAPTTAIAATTARLPEPAPSAAGGSSGAAVDEDEGAGDLVACTSALFAADAFDKERVTTDFPCNLRDARKGVLRMTSVVARGGQGAATQAAKEWATLGWYQIAAYAVARATCCPGAEPVETPRLLGMCKIDLALESLAKAANGGTDDQLASALDAYRGAIHCAFTAGGAAYFDQKGAPTIAEAAVFLRMLTRLRASRR